MLCLAGPLTHSALRTWLFIWRDETAKDESPDAEGLEMGGARQDRHV